MIRKQKIQVMLAQIIGQLAAGGVAMYLSKREYARLISSWNLNQPKSEKDIDVIKSTLTEESSTGRSIVDILADPKFVEKVKLKLSREGVTLPPASSHLES